MNTRAKFILESIKKVNWNKDMEILEFTAVGPTNSDNIGENALFHRYSPNGKLHLSVDNPALLGKFTIGAYYYLDLTLCEPLADPQLV